MGSMGGGGMFNPVARGRSLSRCRESSTGLFEFSALASVSEAWRGFSRSELLAKAMPLEGLEVAAQHLSGAGGAPAAQGAPLVTPVLVQLKARVARSWEGGSQPLGSWGTAKGRVGPVKGLDFMPSVIRSHFR